MFRRGLLRLKWTNWPLPTEIPHHHDKGWEWGQSESEIAALCETSCSQQHLLKKPLPEWRYILAAVFFLFTDADSSVTAPCLYILLGLYEHLLCGTFATQASQRQNNAEMHTFSCPPGRVSCAHNKQQTLHPVLWLCFGADSSLRFPSDTFQTSHSCLKVISLWEVAKAQWQTKALFQIQFCAFSPKQWNTQFPPCLFGELQRGNDMLLLTSVSVFLLREDDLTAYVGHVVLI